MNDFSKEVIEIDGNEYTLFLNRTGLVAIEKYTKDEVESIEKMQQTVEKSAENTKIDDTTDPFEGLENVENVINNIDDVKNNIYRKMFWIMLRTTHKLTPNECFELYDKAVKEYGNQVNLLIDQIVEDMNKDKFNTLEQTNTKNLKALRPAK